MGKASVAIVIWELDLIEGFSTMVFIKSATLKPNLH